MSTYYQVLLEISANVNRSFFRLLTTHSLTNFTLGAKIKSQWFSKHLVNQQSVCLKGKQSTFSYGLAPQKREVLIEKVRKLCIKNQDQIQRTMSQPELFNNLVL